MLVAVKKLVSSSSSSGCDEFKNCFAACWVSGFSSAAEESEVLRDAGSLALPTPKIVCLLISFDNQIICPPLFCKKLTCSGEQ